MRELALLFNNGSAGIAGYPIAPCRYCLAPRDRSNVLSSAQVPRTYPRKDRPMTKRLIGIFLASSLFMTSFAAAPARAASEQDVARFLAGAVTLYILGQAVTQNKKSKATTSNNASITAGKQNKYRKKPLRKTLPAECRFNVRTKNGTRAVFGERCLENRLHNVHRLPDRCEFTIQTRRGKRDVYGARCLRRAGYRVEA